MLRVNHPRTGDSLIKITNLPVQQCQLSHTLIFLGRISPHTGMFDFQFGQFIP